MDGHLTGRNAYPRARSALDGHLAGRDGENARTLLADVVEPLQRLVRVATLRLEATPEQPAH